MHLILNPPYCKNLHLKILQEAMKHSDDVVNLSPIRWLQDPLAEYKKNSDWKKFESVRERIESLDVVSMKEACDLFGALFNTDLGIYHITKKGGFDCKKLIKSNTHIVDACIKCGFPELVRYDENDERAFVSIRTITNLHRTTAYDIVSHNNGIFIKGKTTDGKAWRDVLYKTKTCNDDRVPLGIYFDTKDEAENFIKWSDTKTIKYFVKQLVVDQHIYAEFLPFMPTYTHPWTDEMLYSYFGLTEDEVNEIEQEIK